MKVALFLDLATCRLLALIMEAVQTSEIFVNLYQSTWRYNVEDSHLQNHRLENLKSYLSVTIYVDVD
jgi:hypothetical protein